VEDIINSVLGRDPEQMRPPTGLAWEPLIKLLDREGITVAEDELIATPFVFELSDELLAEFTPEADQGHRKPLHADRQLGVARGAHRPSGAPSDDTHRVTKRMQTVTQGAERR